MTKFVEKLPSAHTCFFMLMLPAYKSEEVLRQKLYKVVECDGNIGYSSVPED